MDTINNTPQISLWKCACGTRYRALSERNHSHSITHFACPTCGAITPIDGEPVEISQQVGEAWIKIADQ